MSGGMVKMRQAIPCDEFSARVVFATDKLSKGEGVLIVTSSTDPTRFVHIYMSRDQVADLHEELGTKLAASTETTHE